MENVMEEKGEVSFGGLLYAFRSARNLTQAQVARAVGLTRGYFSQLENSKRPPPPLGTVDKICRELKLSVAESRQLRQAAAGTRVHQGLSIPMGSSEPLSRLIRILMLESDALSPATIRKIDELVNEDVRAKEKTTNPM